MIEQLRQAQAALLCETGADRAVLLPYPYARGHFRLYGCYARQDSERFRYRVENGCTYAAMTNAYLAALCLSADAAFPLPPIGADPEGTLLLQVLRHGFCVSEDDNADLMRLILDFGQDEKKDQMIYRRALRVLGERYALALRKKQKESMLPVIARRILAHHSNAFACGQKEEP